MTAHAFSFFGRVVRLRSDDADVLRLLVASWGALRIAADPCQIPAALDYQVDRQASGGFAIVQPSRCAQRGLDSADLLFYLEKDITVELEKIRSDLYFLHAAALVRDGRVVLVVAESGVGKSTTTWALLHHGFAYASDELAPVELETRVVHPYPHALCLKADPPAPYTLPAATLRTCRTRHVPTEALPGPVVESPVPLDVIIFLSRPLGATRASARPMGAAEASARLYVNALNPLAHPANGLEAAIQIAERARCYALQAADLPSTCRTVLSALASD